MKLILLLIPLIEIIPLTSESITPVIKEGGFKSIECSPLNIAKSRLNFTASFKTRIKTARVYKVELYYEKISTYDTILSFESNEYTVKKELEYTPIRIGDAKIRFSIISSSTGSVFNEVSLDLKYYSSKDLSIFEAGEFVAESKFVCYSSTIGVYEKAEKFTYNCLEKDINVNKKPYIDFSSFRIKYTSEVEYYQDLTYKYARLFVLNPDGIYDDVADSFSGSIANFNLLLEKDPSTGEYYLIPSTTWYIDIQTALMSKTDKGNCIKTNKIHIPSKYFPNASSLYGLITIYGMGFNHTSIRGQFNFIDGQNLFGSCEDSEYCVKEGSGDSDYEMGEVYEH